MRLPDGARGARLLRSGAPDPHLFSVGGTGLWPVAPQEATGGTPVPPSPLPFCVSHRFRGGLERNNPVSALWQDSPELL
jgi:hypothetical protein